MSGAHKLAHTTGVLWIHSAPRSLCPHITWALESVFDTAIRLQWQHQAMGHGLLRCELTWSGPVGTGANTASALRALENIRFEVSEDPTHASMGSRWAYAPGLGMHHAWVAHNGDIVVNENRLHDVLHATSAEEMRRRMGAALGHAWDQELEPYRLAGDSAASSYHRVG